MDQFDKATELEEQHREQALAAQARRQPNGHSYSHCEDCGEPIPEGRRKAMPGCHRCIPCQQLHEQGGA
ncbi:TraR/DksA family transcriptional regulator [Paludibacterium yongneupense]|uniref:TraR/DksA family transcriptional regulator n=1 Tax=Paludibacterium yongneupense TaxID=400061 RepID=UPI00041684A3|nr:TraR/DksA family transcriptional regulator [Paludibacterium yongneupense]